VLDASGHIAHRHVGVLDAAVFQRDFSRWFPTVASPAAAAGSEDGR